jgi:hypothetical protein
VIPKANNLYCRVATNRVAVRRLGGPQFPTREH